MGRICTDQDRVCQPGMIDDPRIIENQPSSVTLQVALVGWLILMEDTMENTMDINGYHNDP